MSAPGTSRRPAADRGRSAAGRATAAAAFLLGAQLTTAGCGPKGPHGPWVHRIYFDGVKQIKEKDIRGKMLVQQSPWVPLTPKKYLDHSLSAEVDRERIAAYYRTRGYYSADVPKVEVTPYKVDDKKPKDDPTSIKAVDIRYKVEEGKPVKIAKLNIEGLEGIGEDGEHAVKKLALKPGQIFEHEPYLLEKEKVLQRLRKRGYAFAAFLSAEAAIDRTALTAELTWIIDPGPKVVLGDVTLEGTSQVDAEALKKHAAIPTGDRYHPDTMDGVQGKLYNLGLFSAVNVEPVPNPERPDVADVKITVTEGKFRELRLGVGLGIESLRTEVHGEMIFTQRRFFGGLRVLQLTLKPGYAALPAVWANPIYRHGPMLLSKAEFTQPDLIGPSSALTLALTYNLGIEYAYQYHGPEARIGLTRAFWKERIKLAAAYDFQFLDFFNIDPSITDPGKSGSLFGFVDPYRLAYFQELASLDLRNRPVDARSGFFMSLLFEHGGVYTGSAFDYQKLMPEVRGYIPLGERVTIAARIQFGQMFTQTDLGSPITQRFYLGGPNSHRGFTYNRLSYQVCSATPKEGTPIPMALASCDVDKTLFAEFRRIPVGGDQMVLGQLELRVALFKLFKNWLSLVAFSDAGDVAAPRTASCSGPNCTEARYGSQVDLTRLHVAVGGGLRYKTVIGTVRLDLGVRVNRVGFSEADGYENPDPDERIAYHISIGEAF